VPDPVASLALVPDPVASLALVPDPVASLALKRTCRPGAATAPRPCPSTYRPSTWRT